MQSLRSRCSDINNSAAAASAPSSSRGQTKSTNEAELCGIATKERPILPCETGALSQSVATVTGENRTKEQETYWGSNVEGTPP